jgi:signal transduction histidine kinase
MKIRVKLLSGLGFYILFALGLGVFAYGELRTITNRLEAVETADDLTNTMLEVRRYEKNYLLFKDEESSQRLKHYLAELRTGAERIEAETLGEIPPKSFDALRAALAEYEKIFDDLVGTLRQQELVKRKILEIGGSIENGLRGGDDLYQLENVSLERMRTTARDIQALAEDLSRRQRAAITSLLQHSRRSVRILLLAIVAAIAVGVVIDAQLSRSIATPIRHLENLTLKIAAGDLSGRISVRGEDEFSSLARSFNQMQDRLHDTLTTLELANEDLRTNRAQLVEAEKFATLGRFSTGVAHEINNPLAVINEKAGLMTDYLARVGDFPDRERFTALLNAIAENVTRCSVITHRILNFASVASTNPEAIDVNSLLGELLKSFEQQLLAKHILLTLDLREGLPVVRTGRAQVRQVLADIVKNRVDAAATGGLIRVSTEMRDAKTLQVSISDNGPVLQPETLEHLFDPFSTVGEIGRDPGLGLWISRGIIKKLGGEILVSSEPVRGTIFTIEIPVPVPPEGPEPA